MQTKKLVKLISSEMSLLRDNEEVAEMTMLLNNHQSFMHK